MEGTQACPHFRGTGHIILPHSNLPSLGSGLASGAQHTFVDVVFSPRSCGPPPPHQDQQIDPDFILHKNISFASAECTSSSFSGLGRVVDRVIWFVPWFSIPRSYGFFCTNQDQQQVDIAISFSNASCYCCCCCY